jgi:hypothetical protein
MAVCQYGARLARGALSCTSQVFAFGWLQFRSYSGIICGFTQSIISYCALVPQEWATTASFLIISKPSFSSEAVKVRCGSISQHHDRNLFFHKVLCYVGTNAEGYFLNHAHSTVYKMWYLSSCNGCAGSLSTAGLFCAALTLDLIVLQSASRRWSFFLFIRMG